MEWISTLTRREKKSNFKILLYEETILMEVNGILRASKFIGINKSVAILKYLVTVKQALQFV